MLANREPKRLLAKESTVEERPKEESAIESEVQQPDPKKELHGTAHPPANEGVIPSN